jgi:hypothetical protein
VTYHLGSLKKQHSGEVLLTQGLRRGPNFGFYLHNLFLHIFVRDCFQTLTHGLRVTRQQLYRCVR